MDLPVAPPFAIRARLLTPLDDGGTLHEADGLVVVDGAGRLTYAGPATGEGAPAAARDVAVDLRPWVVLPGMVDLHVHLPQIPNAGLGAGLDLLTWLDRYIFPLERGFDAATAERVAPLAWQAFAAALGNPLSWAAAGWHPPTLGWLYLDHQAGTALEGL